MLRSLLFALGIALVGCATGGGDLDGLLDGGRPDGATNTDGGSGGCGVGLRPCGSECVDLAFDRENCGACGNVCKTTEVCKAGKCSSDCGTLTQCTGEGGTKCVNTATDSANCGGCGKACPTGQLCSGGTCAPDCGADTRCPGAAPYCANLQNDVKNCGYCGNTCPAGQECVTGSCALVCKAPESKCGTSCTNTDTDPSNCGSCGRSCTLANATAGCAGGACTVASCSTGYGNCDGVASNGCETNTATDVSNCGGCGTRCTVANGSPGCAAGSCTVASCSSGFGNCDGTAANGCETNLNTNNSNCGMCGRTCPSGQTCRSGSCAIATGTYNATIAYSGSPYCPGVGLCGVAAYVCLGTAGSAGISRTFTDPTPSGSRAVSVTVRVYGAGCSGGTVTVTLNGVTVGTYSALSNCACGSCDPAYTVTLNNSAGIPGYVYGGANTLNLRSSGSGMCTQRSEIAVTTG